MTDTIAMAPDERALLAHLKTARFLAGVDGHRWRLLSIDWPHALIAVAAAARDNSPAEVVLRFDLADYPQRAPTAGPWDTDLDTPLSPERRPKGEMVSRVFRADWESGKALYAPWDRVALESHDDWARKYPLTAWHPKRDLTFYLTNVHDLLNDGDYLGV